MNIRLGVAALLATAVGGNAYAADGAHWTGNIFMQASRLVNGNPAALGRWVNPPFTHAGMCSYWFSAPTTSAQQAGVIGVYPNMFNALQDATPSVLIEHVSVAGSMRLHLKVQLPGAVTSYMDSYSLNPVQYFTGTESPQSQHNYLILWDSWQNLVQMRVDDAVMGIDGSVSSSLGTPFAFSADGAAWSVGAQLVNGATRGTFNPVNFVKGDTNQIVCLFGDNVYSNLLKSYAMPSPVELPIHWEVNQALQLLGGPYPTNMGPWCTNVYGSSNEWPYICLRGSEPYWHNNDSLGIFTVFGGTLAPATYSPFDLIPTTYP